MPVNSTRRRPALIAAVAGAAVLGIVAVLYTALSPSPTSRAASTQPNPPNAGASSAPAVFTAHTLTGGTVEVPGTQPSVLFFFSVECGTCGPGAQALAAALSTTPQPVNFVAVDISPYETDDDIARFLTANKATSLAYATDHDARLIGAYQVTRLSTAVVLDDSGTVVFRGVDPTAEQIQNALAKVTAR